MSPADEPEESTDEALTAPAVVLASGPLMSDGGGCLDVYSGSPSPGTKADVWICNGTPAQTFAFWSDGSVRGPGGNCLDAAGGGQLVMNACAASPTQRWVLRGQHLVGVNNGCLASGGAPHLGFAAPPALAAPCDTSDSTWTLLEVHGTVVGTGGRCVDVNGNSSADGAGVDVTTCNGTTAQSFHFDAAQQIVNDSGKCLEVVMGTSGYGLVDMRTCNSTGSQQWSLVGRSLKSALGSCLNVEHGSLASTAWLDVELCNGKQEQQWFVTRSYAEGMATLLVVTDAALQASAQRLVDHKNATGMPAALVTIDQLTSQFLGCSGAGCPPNTDVPTAVKRGIDYFYRYRGTKYVLLAGDASHVPTRFVYVYDQNHENSGTTISYRSSDFYYANLYQHVTPTPFDGTRSDVPGAFSTWDASGNGRYDEFDSNAAPDTPQYNPDHVDGYPDVAVGRVSANTPTQLDTYVTKVIAYETTTMPGAGHGLFIGDAAYNSGNSPLGIWDAASMASAFSGLPSTRMVVDDSGGTSIPPGWIDGTKQDVLGDLQTNGWVVYAGHGSPNGFGPIGQYDVWGTQQTNLPLVFAAACWTGTFVPTQGVGEKVPQTTPPPPQVGMDPLADSFANYWLTYSPEGGGTPGTGGAIAYAGEGIELDDSEGTNLLVKLGGRWGAGEKTLGDLWRGAQEDYWHTTTYLSPQVDATPRIFFGIMTLFGDPSLRVQRGSGPVR